jgi:hypothetical protein
MFANDELIIWNGNVYANDSKKLTCNNLKGWSIDDEYLMQSTGLVDKNGKEIFEGDIVKTTRFFGRADEVGGFYEYDKEIIGVVKQLEGAWVIDTGSEAVNLWTEIEENEVIGNVYEQPEYLKKKGN